MSVKISSMYDYDKLIEKVLKVQHGFKEMKEEASVIVGSNSTEESFTTAQKLFLSKYYQVRMVAVFIMGMIASGSKDVFAFMRDKVSEDESWQVQEVLAQAFDLYCKDNGYERSLPVIKKWLKNKNPNVRRAVSEGLRVWNYKDYFKRHPDIAISLLSQLRDDKSEYVRKSAGNAIRDISRKEKELVKKELITWDTSNKSIKQVYELASKFL